MNTNNKLKKLLWRAAETVIALSGVLLYGILSHRMSAGALLVSGAGFLPVLLLAALGWGAVLLLPSPVEETLSEDVEEEERSEEELHLSKEETSEGADMPAEEYPELFKTREAEEETASEGAAALCRETLKNAIAAQKVQYAPEEEEADEGCVKELFFDKEKERETPFADIYESLPDTLPEGYILPADSWEGEDGTEDAADGKALENSIPSVKGGAVKRAVAAAILLAICLGAAYVLGSDCAVFFEDSFAVRTVAGEKTYSWEDCTGYEIAPSFFGDRLEITVYTRDGEKVKLLSSVTSTGDSFSQKYGSVYGYVLHACERMDAGGAEKTVKERKTIESRLTVREDIGEYVKELID